MDEIKEFNTKRGTAEIKAKGEFDDLEMMKNNVSER
jgi:hypothetical protein